MSQYICQLEPKKFRIVIMSMGMILKAIKMKTIKMAKQRIQMLLKDSRRKLLSMIRIEIPITKKLPIDSLQLEFHLFHQIFGEISSLNQAFSLVSHLSLSFSLVHSSLRQSFLQVSSVVWWLVCFLLSYLLCLLSIECVKKMKVHMPWRKVHENHHHMHTLVYHRENFSPRNSSDIDWNENPHTHEEHFSAHISVELKFHSAWSIIFLSHSLSLSQTVFLLLLLLYFVSICVLDCDENKHTHTPNPCKYYY